MEYWTTKEGKEILWKDLKDSHLESIVKGLNDGISFGVRSQDRSIAIFSASQELLKRELVKAIKNSPSLALLLTSPHKCLRDLAESPSETIDTYFIWPEYE
jgi:hypothetical protein